MTDLLLPLEEGSTLLTEEEREGLKLSYVTTRGELNAAEQANILQAEGWAFKNPPVPCVFVNFQDLNPPHTF